MCGLRARRTSHCPTASCRGLGESRTPDAEVAAPCLASWLRDRQPLERRTRVRTRSSSSVLFLAPEEGLEPPTSRLTAGRSASRAALEWSRPPDSNRIPSAYKADALPGELRRRGSGGRNRTSNTQLQFRDQGSNLGSLGSEPSALPIRPSRSDFCFFQKTCPSDCCS